MNRREKSLHRKDGKMSKGNLLKEMKCLGNVTDNYSEFAAPRYRQQSTRVRQEIGAVTWIELSSRVTWL